MLELKYLGRTLTATDNDWSAVVRKLRKARRSWGWLSRVLVREGTDPKVSREFYISVTQAVLIFDSEKWVLTARSCSSPRWDNLDSGDQPNPLLGLILGYMYWGQKHSSE